MAGSVHKDITGNRYGYLTAEAWIGVRVRGKSRSTMWLFRCDCGNVVERRYRDVASRPQQLASCGCQAYAGTRKANVTHDRSYRRGAGRDRTYAAWQCAKSRCYNERDAHFPRWGGRGIVMCAPWREDFDAFLRDMGDCPPGHSLDRIDNDGNYEPSNCRWADARGQVNNRGVTLMVEYRGAPTPLALVAEAENKNYFSLYNYLIKRPRRLEDALALASGPYYGTKCGRRRRATTASTKAA